MQTDNGVEHGGVIHSRGSDAFTAVVQTAGARHVVIRSGASTRNAEVEAFHHRMEEEFLQVECLRTRPTLAAKAYAHILWFDLLQLNFRRQG